MIVINCQQGTQEWLEARAGVITASRFADAINRLTRKSEFGEKGDFSGIAQSYAWTLAVERVAGKHLDDTFKSWHMKRGNELEYFARNSYEVNTGLWADESGIVLTDDRAFGYSTDGFVGSDGMIEIKCPANHLKIGQALTNMEKLKEEYIHQIQGGLWLTGRKWCDLVIYCDWLKPVNKDTIIHRIDRDENFIEILEKDLLEFKNLVDFNEKILRN